MIINIISVILCLLLLTLLCINFYMTYKIYSVLNLDTNKAKDIIENLDFKDILNCLFEDDRKIDI